MLGASAGLYRHFNTDISPTPADFGHEERYFHAVWIAGWSNLFLAASDFQQQQSMPQIAWISPAVSRLCFPPAQQTTQNGVCPNLQFILQLPVCRISFESRGQGEFEHGRFKDSGPRWVTVAVWSMISNFGGPTFLEKATIQSQLGPLVI